MIQKIQDHVYRVHKPDLRLHMTDLFDEICRMHLCDFSYSFITSRTDHRINGYQDIVDSVANDYRSHALLIVTPMTVANIDTICDKEIIYSLESVEEAEDTLRDPLGEEPAECECAE